MSGLISQIPVTETAFSNLQWLEGQRTTGESVKIPAALMQTGPNIDLFTSIGSVTVPTGVNVVQTSGYSTAGVGQGVYVSDSLATSALAASCPNFCKLSADGRYWRLDGDYITVDQGGATGTVGVNDQPAIQAAINYAQTIGIQRVTFPQAAYELWCPIRTTQTLPGGPELDGYPIIITTAMSLQGKPTGTSLTFKNSLGGPNTVITQTTTWGQWIGGGIWVNPNYTGATANIPFIDIENLTLVGTSAFTPGSGLTPPPNTGVNLSDKGIGMPSGPYGVVKMTLRNIIAHDFQAEIFYGGALKANSTLVAENVELYNSNQCAWNPTGIGKVFATNLYCHDCYLASEIILGQGHTYVDCTFANAYNAGCVGTQYFSSGYPYWFPFSDTSEEPTWCNYINTTFQNITQVLLGSWNRGSITLIDCSMYNPNWNDANIYLDMLVIIDQSSRGNFLLKGPDNLTTPFASGYPAAGNIIPPSNITLNIDLRRTAYAQAQGYTTDLLDFSGLLDYSSIRISVTGEARYIVSQSVGTRPTGYAQPLVLFDQTIEKMPNGQPFGGYYTSSVTGPLSFDINWTAMNFSNVGSGSYPITVNTNYLYANGQLAIFYYRSGTGTLTFAPTGAGMKLGATRTLAVAGDKLTLRYDSTAGSWVEESFTSARQLIFSGSATYDAPSIATGGTTTTTVTVTGASVGDYVRSPSFGVSLAGLMATAYVSSANTVTVVLYNPTAGAIDLASTTLSIEVMKKVP